MVSAASPARVTVAIPTFNRASFLPQTIESLLAQGYSDLEIIVVDDGSTDDTRDVVSAWQVKHPDTIKYYKQNNQGEAAATNFAWSVATGRYFCLVCSDDPQPPELLRTSVDFLRRHPAVIVSYPDWWRLDERGGRIERVVVPEYSLERLVAQCHCFVGPGALIDRDAVYDRLPILRDPRFRLVSDYSSWLRLCRLGPFMRIDAPIAAWRDHAAGGTAINRGRRFAREHVELLMRYFDDPTLPPEIRQYEYRAKARIHRVASACVTRSDPTYWLRYRLAELLYVPPIDLPALLRRR